MPTCLPTRSAIAITGATNFVAMLQSSVYKFTPVTTMLFGVEGDMCRMRFEKNSPENGNLNGFGLGLFLRNENKLTGIFK